MKLSENEIRMVEELRKRQTTFRRWRLLQLIVFGLLVLANLGLLNLLINLAIADPLMKTTLVAFMFPMMLVFLGFSVFAFSETIWNWRGEPTRDLLLRVVEELQKRDA